MKDIRWVPHHGGAPAVELRAEIERGVYIASRRFLAVTNTYIWTVSRETGESRHAILPEGDLVQHYEVLAIGVVRFVRCNGRMAPYLPCAYCRSRDMKAQPKDIVHVQVSAA